MGDVGHFVVFIGDGGGGGVHFCASGAVVCVSSTVLGPNELIDSRRDVSNTCLVSHIL